MPNKNIPGGYNNFHIGKRLVQLSKFPNAQDLLTNLGTNIRAWLKDGSFYSENKGRELLTKNFGIDKEVHAVNYEGMPATYLEKGSLAEVAIAFANDLQSAKAKREKWDREMPEKDRRRWEKESKEYPPPVELSQRRIKYHLKEIDEEVRKELRPEVIDVVATDVGPEGE